MLYSFLILKKYLNNIYIKNFKKLNKLYILVT